MYTPTARPGLGYAGVPRFRGMGDATATCPSLSQLAGITDPNDPCQGGAGGQICFNTATGRNFPCPVAGVTQTTPPGQSGPFGLPASGGVQSFQAWLAQNSALVWGIAGVTAALVLLGGRGR